MDAEADRCCLTRAALPNRRNRIAKAVGRTDDCDLLVERSKNYKNVFDPSTTFVRPRLENGQWSAPFEPTEMGHSEQRRDYTESDRGKRHFRFSTIPRDICNCSEAGRRSSKSWVHFLLRVHSSADAPPDIAGMVGQYAHGNEPCHHMAYLYSYAGVPHKTQARLRSLLEME